VNYYANHESDDALKPYGWAGKHWSSAVAAEHRATRENAGLFDESSFAKAIVSGAQAAEFLNWVCANDVVKGVGRTVYTQALNTRGGIESDYTVTQTADTEFFIITGTAFSTHDFGWLEKQKREGNFNGVTIKVVTEELACFALMGPKARTILAKTTDYDLSHANFPFMHSREINIAGTKVRATRLTYVGELGWEIYVPVADGKKVWEALIAAGADEGLMPCGYRAIESLRLEKGYRAWAGEINTETTPLEAGLGFAISKKKEKFIGKDALTSAKQTRKLVAMTFDDIRQVPLGNEPVRINGSVVGRVKSGGQGYTINKAIGYAYLPTEHTTPGTTVDVEFFGTWATGVICAEPLFDPENSKIRL
jgi:4-methylaminobutanoate oxidase (formaldehyde-forming)